jgi:hypothetical protein
MPETATPARRQSRAPEAPQSGLQLVQANPNQAHEPEGRPQETPKAKPEPKPTATADLGSRVGGQHRMRRGRGAHLGSRTASSRRSLLTVPPDDPCCTGSDNSTMPVGPPSGY